MPNSCRAILCAPFWPIVCIALGLIGGTISGAVGTLIVFLVALVHFPFQVWKTFSVAATTFFEGNSGIWRLPVLLLSPIGPISFLLVSTLVSATFGTLAQIGSATGILYEHDFYFYAKARENLTSNLKFEEDSKLGEFLVKCRKLVDEDDYAESTIQFVKILLTTAVACAFSFLAFVPFAVAMAAVTVYRLPINFFKTMKIALFTVVLQLDLRIIVLLTLPLIHILFPVIVLVVSMIGCFFWTWAQTQQNFYKGRRPFHEWGQLVDVVKDYYEEHRKFVSERFDPFDHPTGIPMGWNGQQYGLAMERIVRFQLNFLLCVALMLYQTPIIIAGTGAIVLIKYIPVCLNLWKDYTKECLCNIDCVVVLIAWPFHVLAIVLTPLGAALYASCFVLFALLVAYWDVVHLIFWEHAPICECLSVPFANIRRCDIYTSKYYLTDDNFRLVTKQCCPCSVIGDDDEEEGAPPPQRSSSSREFVTADDYWSCYWDRFARQCIQSTAELLANGFLDFDSIEGMDPSCVQSIPSVAVFAILMDSLQREGLKRGDIYWKVDDKVCMAKGRKQLDNIAALLWPMVLDLQNFLKNHKETILKHEEDQKVILSMQALLCDNHDSDGSTDAIRKVLDDTSEEQKALNNEIRTKISRLVLAILRVRPFQERMEKIFEYKYENPNKTMDDPEAQPLDDKVSAGTCSEETEADPNNEEETIAGKIREKFGKENANKTMDDLEAQPLDDKVSAATCNEETEADPNSEEETFAEKGDLGEP